MGENEDIPIYVLVRLWGNKHSHILSLEIQNGTTFLGVFSNQNTKITYVFNF